MPIKIKGISPAAQSAQRLHELESLVKQQEKEIRVLSDAVSRAHSHPPVRLKISKPAIRIGGSFTRVIIPDSHGSAIDPIAAAAFLRDLKQLAPKEIVMLGDHVDCGGFLAQHHTLGYVAQADYSYCDDISMANDFLDEIDKASPDSEKHYIEGNHERRVETWCVTQTLRNKKDAEYLRKAFAPEYMLHLKERGIKYYRQAEHYHGVRVPGAIRLGKCFFWHGVSTAAHAATVNLSQFGGNVVYGHTHREDHGSRRPVSQGTIAAWNPGCLCKLQPLWCHTRPTDWNTGYGIQTVAASGDFLHVNIPIVDGRSLLLPLLNQKK
jgi:UDP-2,3-diacylglucosamine pyrophosphatase LpxH